ncbi:MAG: hypothetical protein CMQ41_07630 [Gammaproteobacteria bacterium]|nr:hypothetical protein [Gammaproteobacteria bacterium]|tara:strand:- start:715 stop:1611 length:897 start_codon:yes stop_codon:yes gene_type:complete
MSKDKTVNEETVTVNDQQQQPEEVDMTTDQTNSEQQPLDEMELEEDVFAPYDSPQDPTTDGFGKHIGDVIGIIGVAGFALAIALLGLWILFLALTAFIPAKGGRVAARKSLESFSSLIYQIVDQSYAYGWNGLIGLFMVTIHWWTVKPVKGVKNWWTNRPEKEEVVPELSLEERTVLAREIQAQAIADIKALLESGVPVSMNGSGIVIEEAFAPTPVPVEEEGIDEETAAQVIEAAEEEIPEAAEIVEPESIDYSSMKRQDVYQIAKMNGYSGPFVGVRREEFAEFIRQAESSVPSVN